MTDPLSPNNPRLKRLGRLTRDPKARRDELGFVIEGPRAIETFVSNGGDLQAVFTSGTSGADLGFAIGNETPVHLVDRQVLDRLADAGQPQGVVAIATMVPAAIGELEGTAPIVVLDGVQDPGNVGAIVRVSVAMGCAGVICATGCADPFSPKAVRASAGTVGGINVVTGVDVADAIGQAGDLGFTAIGANMAADVMLDALEVVKPVALVLGGEGAGLSSEALGAVDQTVGIEMAPLVESLNVAVTAGIVLHQLRSRSRQQ